ncbi:DUF1183-domain-containing protein [Gigaspora margarita]|uniref:Store-operated calcium entry-associated regulatory factor n=1 Tax=Gigaspora margarita TaxID=4874 RepID=A0A8H4AQE3_GIGMA|nr:DUF1183-domain-containing protein [Gigaspora margarita]
MKIIFISLLYLSYIEAAWDKVLLENVKTITLYRGKLTAGRRNNPIEQISCVGGDACHMYTPDVIQCTNTGSDGLDVNWRCNAELPDYLKFGPLTVNCEGYSYPDDPYILHGSCGLEYTLYYKDNWRNDRSHQRFEDDEYFRYNDCLVLFILYKIYSSFTGQRNFRPNNNNNYQNFWPGGGGGGGFYPRHDSFDQYSSQSGGGIGQNFWTGLGLGGVAGYFMGRNNSSQRPRPRTTVFTSPPSRPSSSSSSSSSSNMTNAQGFGNTRRR